MTEPVMMEVEGLEFSYPDLQVLKGVSLSLRQGEVLCLLGPNGCGKTTLFDCLLGHHKPSAGRILVRQKPLNEISRRDLALTLAYVPQDHHPNFSYTVTDFVLMGGSPRRSYFDGPDEEERSEVRDMLDRLGLGALKDKDYSLLSGGEIRMILIARALHQTSPVLIMDEPGSHLDFRNEFLMLQMVVSLVRDHRRSVLMSTHHPNQVFFLQGCGIPVRAAVMNQGKIILQGDPREVLTPKTIKKLYGIDTAGIHQIEAGGEVRCLIPLPPNQERINHE